MNAERYLSVLNPEQYEACVHEGSPLLILAGAGSGKTRVITTKIAYLIGERGLAPESILAVTFTNKAAREMLDRATRLEPKAERSMLRTFHSFGAWLLRRNASLIDLDPNFTIYDDDDATSLLSKAVPSLTRQQASLTAHKIARAKDYCLGPKDPRLTEIDTDPDFALVYEAYEKRLRQTGNLDFGDLILLPVRLLNENPEVKSRLHQRFSVVMVDEYQDSNLAQFELLKALTGANTYLCVVGDDDQSIYKFRGAEVQNILTFQDSFPGTQIVRLERNYRSVSPILAVASEIVANNEGRLGKTLLAERGSGKKPILAFLPNQDDETAFCAELIQKSHTKGCPWADWAILYRTNAQSLGFETEFLHRKIPYKLVGSLKFYEREEIKDILAVLALVSNAKDEIAFRRIINKPARCLGAVTQEKIITEARSYLLNPVTTSQELSFDTSLDLIKASRSLAQTMPKKAKAGLLSFINLIEDLRLHLNTENTEPELAKLLSDQALVSLDTKEDKTQKKLQKASGLALFVEKAIENSGLLAYHQGQDEVAGTQRVSNLEELVNAASLYPCTPQGLTDFLEHIELDRSLSSQEESPDAVSLITIHNTKGLEFPRVIITGMEAGIFPRENKQGEDLEEERRLMYVGCTRAMDELYLTSCSLRRLYGQTNFMEPSTFLFEIPSQNIEVIGNPPLFWQRQKKGEQTRLTPKKNVETSKNPIKKVKDFSTSKWSVGKKLFHDDYGYGIITKSYNEEGEHIIFVRFESGGEKRFMPKYQAKNLLLVDE